MEFLPTAQAVSVFMVVLFLAYLTAILVPYAPIGTRSRKAMIDDCSF
jgi:hypothetical protein